MSTQRQKKLAKAIVENQLKDKPEHIGKILENIGYAKSTSEAIPGEIVSTKGVQDELVRLGFTEQNAKSVVAEIMNDPEKNPNDRLKAADMTFKVHGSYAPEKSLSLELKSDLKDITKYQELANKYEQELFKTIENE